MIKSHLTGQLKLSMTNILIYYFKKVYTDLKQVPYHILNYQI